jgi:proteasome lid subunit RPN8/RPN11
MVEPPDDVNVELGETVPSDRGADSPSVLISASALLEMNLHAVSEPEHEIGGIMLGQVVEGTGLVVIVEDVIRGTKMDHGSGSVTFTHETWSEINRIKDEQFPDSKVVGWYHSHPGFGIFLSGHDLFIHKNFFTQPWQIAFVTDPRARSCGAFVWQDQGLVQEEFGVLTSAEAFVYPSLSPERLSDGPAPAVAGASLGDMFAQQPRQRRDFSLMLGLGMLGMLLTIVLLITLTNYLTLRRVDRGLGDLYGRMGALETRLEGLSGALSPVQQLPTPAPSPPAAPGQGDQPQSSAGGELQPPPPAAPPATGSMPATGAYGAGP